MLTSSCLFIHRSQSKKQKQTNKQKQQSQNKTFDRVNIRIKHNIMKHHNLFSNTLRSVHTVCRSSFQNSISLLEYIYFNIKTRTFELVSILYMITGLTAAHICIQYLLFKLVDRMLKPRLQMAASSLTESVDLFQEHSFQAIRIQVSGEHHLRQS